MLKSSLLKLRTKSVEAWGYPGNASKPEGLPHLPRTSHTVFTLIIQTEVQLVAPNHICLILADPIPKHLIRLLGRAIGQTDKRIFCDGARILGTGWDLNTAEILCVFQGIQMPHPGQEDRSGAGEYF